MYTPVIILRTTSNCNMKCSYCYDKNKLKNEENPDILFKNNINNIIQYINRLSSIGGGSDRKIILHGGEPLLIKSDTYKNFFEELLNSGGKCSISVQTNGTLLDMDYINIFKKYNIHIGISLDGCDESSNACRLYADKKNTFSDVYNKINLLKEYNIDFGIIMTINKNLINREKELYSFISNNNLKCSIRPAFPTKCNKEIIMSASEYEAFFINLYKIWSNDISKKIKLKQIEDLYQEMRKALDDNYRTHFCSDSKSCFGNFFALDVYGELYACNRSFYNKKFYYGNINYISDKEILEKAKKLKESRCFSVLNSRCQECELLKNCFGGCPAIAEGIYDSLCAIEDSFCKAKIGINKYIKKDLEKSGSIEKYNKYIQQNNHIT